MSPIVEEQLAPESAIAPEPNFAVSQDESEDTPHNNGDAKTRFRNPKPRHQHWQIVMLLVEQIGSNTKSGSGVHEPRA